MVVFLCFTSAVRLVFSCPVPSTYGAAPLDPCPQVTTPELKSLCKGKMFSHVGKRTPVAVRFSTVRSCPHVNTFHTYPAPHIPRRVRIHQRYRFAVTYGSLFHYAHFRGWQRRVLSCLFLLNASLFTYVQTSGNVCFQGKLPTYCVCSCCLGSAHAGDMGAGSHLSVFFCFSYIVRAARQRQPPWRWHNEASVSFHAL